jgi:hypothetical protein
MKTACKCQTAIDDYAYVCPYCAVLFQPIEDEGDEDYCPSCNLLVKLGGFYDDSQDGVTGTHRPHEPESGGSTPPLATDFEEVLF